MGSIYDRKRGVIYEDKQYGGNALEFLYNTIVGRIILRCFVAGKTYSRLNAKINQSSRSVKKIAPFVEEYGVNLDDFEKREYTSFSDFFTRRLAPGKRSFSLSKDDFISVADSKLLCYEITNDGKIPIKNSIYTAKEIAELLKGQLKGGAYRKVGVAVTAFIVGDLGATRSNRQFAAPFGDTDGKGFGLVVRGADGHDALGGKLTLQLQSAVSGRHLGGNPLLHIGVILTVKANHVGKRSEHAVDVGRTAGAGEYLHTGGNGHPFLLSLRNGHLSVPLLQGDLQGIDIEERLSVQRRGGQKRIIQHTLNEVAVAAVALQTSHTSRE